MQPGVRSAQPIWNWDKLARGRAQQSSNIMESNILAQFKHAHNQAQKVDQSPKVEDGLPPQARTGTGLSTQHKRRARCHSLVRLQ